MTIDATTRILLEKYDPTNKALQAPVSASNVESLHAHRQANKAPATSSQKVVYKSASGRTGVITVLMDSAKYDDADIAKACAEFNNLHPEQMSNSYQLPCTYEGIPAGSWVFIEYLEGQ